MILGLFEYLSENQSFLDKGAIITPPYGFGFRRGP